MTSSAEISSYSSVPIQLSSNHDDNTIIVEKGKEKNDNSIILHDYNLPKRNELEQLYKNSIHIKQLRVAIGQSCKTAAANGKLSIVINCNEDDVDKRRTIYKIASEMGVSKSFERNGILLSWE